MLMKMTMKMTMMKMMKMTMKSGAIALVRKAKEMLSEFLWMKEIEDLVGLRERWWVEVVRGCGCRLFLSRIVIHFHNFLSTRKIPCRSSSAHIGSQLSFEGWLHDKRSYGSGLHFIPSSISSIMRSSKDAERCSREHTRIRWASSS